MNDDDSTGDWCRGCGSGTFGCVDCATEELARDAARWRFIRDKLVIQNEETMSGKTFAFLGIDIGAGRIGPELPSGKRLKHDAMEAVFDAALAATLGKP